MSMADVVKWLQDASTTLQECAEKLERLGFTPAPAANVKNRLGKRTQAVPASGDSHAGATKKKGWPYPCKSECFECGSTYTRTAPRSKCPKCYPKKV